MEQKIKEDHLIRVLGRMEDVHSKAGPPDSGEKMELMTKGSYVFRGGSWFITYRETEATGYEGSTTTVKISQDGSQVSMLRYGRANARLVIEKGVRHLCHYDNGYGAMTLGVAADEIHSELGPQGGTARFSYTLDMEPMGFLSHNSVTLQVSPLPRGAEAAQAKSKLK